MPKSSRFLFLFFSIIMVLVMVSGCATITRGTKDVLKIETEPAGAQVKTSNGFYCDKTPCTLKMSRKSKFIVNVTKAGCKPVAVDVGHKTAGKGVAGVAGNLLLGGVVGMGVDMATGASQNLHPNPVIVKLQCG